MKRKTTFLKTLLVAVGLLAGVNAWGGDITLPYEKGTTTNAWTDEDAAAWTGTTGDVYSVTKTDAGITFSISATGNGRYEYAYSHSFTTTDDYKVNLKALWAAGSPTGRVNKNNSYLKFGNVTLRLYGQNSKLTIQLGTSDPIELMVGSAEGNDGTLRAKDFNVDITIYKKTGAVDYSVSCSAWNSGTAVTGSGTLSDATVSSVTVGYDRGGQQLSSFSQTLKTLKITEEEDASSVAEYTINYTLNDKVVKAINQTGVVGDVITADIAIDGEDGYAGNHYLITATEAPSMTLVANADDNKLIVPVRAPYTATLTVNKTIGGTMTPEVINLTETDEKDCSWSYAYSKYVKSGDVYYLCDASTFVFSGTFANGEAIAKSVSYTTPEPDIVFFHEAESTAGTNTDYSYGGSGNVGAQNARDRGISVGTLDAGEYKFTVDLTSANRRSLVIRQGTNDPLASVGTSNEDMTTGVKTASFTLAASTDNLFINGANSGDAKTNQSENFDYVLIKKVVTSVPATIGADGYATFSSAYALDFTDTGIDAYIAKTSATDGVVDMQKVTKAPANTGLFLKGATADVPVTTATTDDVTGNLLVPTTGADIPQGAYVLAKQDENVAFYRLTSALSGVAAGKAYLSIPSSAKSFALNFGDATGIESLRQVTKEGEGQWFNLAGQRVAQPTKGLYIVNGKKVSVK